MRQSARFSLPKYCIQYCIFSLLSPFLAATALGQGTTAVISGLARDSSGAVLPGAVIKVTNVDTGITRTLVTDDGGRYNAPALSPGNYEVQAELAGFRTSVRSGIALSVGREAVVDFTLTVGELTEKVTVVGEASLVETTSPTISGLIDDKQIRDLPLNGRDIMQLVSLSPGATQINTMQKNGSAGFGKGFSVGGARPDQNNFYMDGLNMNDQTNQTPASSAGGVFGADTIREFRVLVNVYSAEFGRNSGGVVSAVTRSGTNEFHGSAFEFLRNDNLDARNFFDPSRVPEFKRNQFGATVGGPIVKDRSFFFGSYEGLRLGLGLSGNVLVPNALARQGTIPDLTKPGRPLITIPVDPQVKPYLDLFPLPNGRDFGDGSAEFINSGTQTATENYFLIRFDHRFSDKDSLSARYTFDDGQMISPNSIPITGETSNTRKQYVNLDGTHLFSPRFLNKVRLGYNRSAMVQLPVDLDPRATALAFVPGRTFGNLSITGAGSLGPNTLYPQIFYYNLYEFADDLDYTRGRHSLRMGTLIEDVRENKDHTWTARGSYSFTSLRNFLQKSANTVEMMMPGSDTIRHTRQALFGFYVQDDFKFRPNLTFNLGLRYEFVTVPTELNNKIATMPDPEHDAKTTLGGALWINPSLKNFAPRIGFAWDPWDNGKTSLRSGFGIFYDQPMSLYYRNPVVRMPPFFVQGNMRNPPFPNFVDAFASGASVPQRLDTIDYYMKQPYRMQWNLNIQREILPQTVVNIGYVGSRSVHLLQSQMNWNAAVPLYTADGQMHWPVDSQGRATGVRRNPNWESIYLRTLGGSGSYNALVTYISRRFSQGFQMQTNYTFSKNIDDNSVTIGSTYSSDSQPQPYSSKLEKGPSAFDVRHIFSLNTTWDLPFGPGKKFGSDWHGPIGKIAEGWQMNSILNVSSGNVFNATLGFDRAGLLPRSGGGGQRPSLLAGASKNPVLGGPDKYFDTSVFLLPPAGYLGNLGRNALTGPGVRNLDLSLVKQTSISEVRKLQFRAEFFNVLNHANFDLPSSTVFASGGVPVLSAGRINNTVTTSRQIQFGLKFIF